ncbi:MAG: hypothetical protein FWC61_02810 [Proteobacteria bacterium]|nr:hypothetical protein [Pseudomonadota bacterium]
MTENSSKKLQTALFIIVALLAALLAWLIYSRMGAAPKPEPQGPGETPEMPLARAIPRALPAVTPDTNYNFDDGLHNPASAEHPQLDDQGAGIASVEIFVTDINGDGKNDRITRTRNENGTAHFYYEYKIELGIGGEYMDITPPNFRTIEGAECSLQKIRFIFAPSFRAIKISRSWQDSWDTPTMASRVIFNLVGNELRAGQTEPLQEICNVSELF